MKNLWSAVYLLLFFNTALFGAYFTPFDGYFPDTVSSEYTEVIAGQMQTIADEFNRDDVIILAGNQENFAQANNNASSSTLLNGSLYTRTEIENVAVGFGTSMGIVNPAGFASITDDLNNGKDSSVGAAVNGLTVYVSADGSNFGMKLLEDVLFDLKLGYFSGDNLIKSFAFDSLMAGGGVRYKIYKPDYSSKNVMIRPLTIGTGVYFVDNSMSVEVDDLKQETTDELTQITTNVTSDLLFEISNTTTTVPLEAVSSARFLGFFNTMLGAGCDMVFGTTEVDLDADTSVSVSHSTIPVPALQSPDLNLHKSSTVENSRNIRFKVLAGIGFEFGMFTLDVPLTYYPADKGFAATLVAAGSF